MQYVFKLPGSCNNRKSYPLNASAIPDYVGTRMITHRGREGCEI